MGADGASLRNASAVPSETQSKRDLLRPLRGIMSKCPRGTCTCMDTWESSLGPSVIYLQCYILARESVMGRVNSLEGAKAHFPLPLC